jgi:hypothetical protein
MTLLAPFGGSLATLLVLLGVLVVSLATAVVALLADY